MHVCAYIYIYIYIYTHVHTMICVSKLEDNLWEPLISTTWVFGMELRLSGLVISAFSQEAILEDQKFFYIS